MAVNIQVIGKRQPDVPQVIETLRSPTGFAGRLDRRQQECDEHSDDGDHNQELDKSKGATAEMN
jgi:hypothetical protein